MNVSLVFVAASFLASAPHTERAAPPQKLEFRTNGFSIAPLEGGRAPGVTQVLSMFLTASGGFAPNVSVQLQAFDGSMEDFIAISKKQFEQTGLKLLSEKRIGGAWAFENEGTLAGHSLHFYARTIKSGATFYLVTATATDAQWADSAAQMKACVDSFDVN